MHKSSSTTDRDLVMQLTFLGTGSAYPSPHRAASSLVLRHESGECWMFDCGEGTQTQLMRSNIKPGKISKIFITHLHGDHVFGLPGLMCTLSQSSTRTEPIDIYGPYGLRKLVKISLELSRSQLMYKYRIHEIMPSVAIDDPNLMDWVVDHSCSSDLHPSELEPTTCTQVDGRWTIFEDGKLRVEAGELRHTIKSYGYVVQEAPQSGALDPQLLKAKGIPPGPDYARLKSGESITCPSGEIIHPHDVIGPSKPSRKLTVLGDTNDASAMAHLCTDTDVLVHEATLENEKREDAIEKGHSTPGMAAEFANTVGARILVLTHFSQRYKTETEKYDVSVQRLVDQAQADFHGKVIAAADLTAISVERKG